ncbi:cation-translocating P-type ATPase [Flaviaesturariibacter flavus]|uniref:Cation-translocating P-type ATPase n=1 Tax=Flaviaesturariibacter flavus TaxID=2502780 RepID=A0A4V2NWX8_9BACT|nr:cation-translocating P-type ATPase [Flaviaesturariibacter flavus]TCJ19072.1 cation-translocating P-type ATPase [Flaviaesturariibacter flavus]
MEWHQKGVSEVLTALNASAFGLSGSEAAQRRDRWGPNVLPEKKRRSPWQLFLSQFRDVMIGVLVVAALISGLVGEVADTVIILLIVLLNAVLGFFQQYRAEQTLSTLKNMAALRCVVLRDGHPADIDATQLVPGDVLLLEAGNSVPADARLLEAHSLQVLEASLTGESVPAQKAAHDLSDPHLPLAERVNMLYKGTQVANGRARALVVATGMQTELGHIAQLLQMEDGPTPLQRRMSDFGKKLSWLILLICMLLFGVGLLQGQAPLPMLLLALSLAVAAIPEALPALIAISLARGAGRLAKNKALVRRLEAVETLGSVTYICTDKTGTLTQNEMTVVEQVPAGGERGPEESLSYLELAMALNHTVRNDGGRLAGDPTEIALVKSLAATHGPAISDTLAKRYPRVAELPFDPVRKRMTTIHRFGDRYLALTKGAVEAIWGIRQKDQRDEPLPEAAAAMARRGIRVLAFGYRLLDRLPESVTAPEIEHDFQFVGMVGMIDPPRAGVADAVRQCREAGIHPVMITGDQRETAIALARSIGLMEAEGALTGPELDGLADEDFAAIVNDIRVYARVSPEQKFRIVNMLQQKGQFVAMTGDGVNDAPSLKKADIGVAMGITGTDTSKEAASMILLDDNFNTIVGAVKEGRRIYDNIRKFIKYIMTCNGAEIWTIFLAPLLGLPVPLLPVHLLWINLATDGLPALALSAGEAEQDVMRRPPRRPDESIFQGMGFHIIWVGLLMAVVTLMTQAISIRLMEAHWQTMVFTVLSLSQLGHAMAIHSEQSLFSKKGRGLNPTLLFTIGITFCLQMLVIYLPLAQRYFHTQALSVRELGCCLALSSIVFFVVEIEKAVKSWRRRAFGAAYGKAA